MSAADKREVVRRGYNSASYSYRSEKEDLDGREPEDFARYGTWIDELASRLEPGAKVIDLGCGIGLPAVKLLLDKRFRVIGVDFANVQIERACRLFPEAKFELADITTWSCAPASCDAIVSFYALIHLPLKEQQILFPRIRSWLRLDGMFMGIVGHEAWTGEEQYHGAQMFWDHADEATYLRWLEESRLTPVSSRYIPEGDGGHSLVLARAI